MTETFQITPEQAEAYEQLFVPALFAQWASPLVGIAQVVPGQHVLDVACGTGVAARAAADIVGDTGAVVGVDVNPAMLAVAARIRPDIQWLEGDAANLPFESGRFDAVLCQSALFFFPDVPAAIAEMARVLRPRGVLAIQTYASVEDQPGFRDLEAIAAKFAPADAMHLIETYWSQGDLSALSATLADAGLQVIETRTVLGTAMYGSVENLVETEIRGTPLVGRLTEDLIEQILAESKVTLDRFVTSDGLLAMPITAHLVAGRR
ncbi:MAG TPA: methyltransferase domain-containing protein, partial [Jiangellaceae bacterium]